MRLPILLALAALSLGVSSTSLLAGDSSSHPAKTDEIRLEEQSWPEDGPFGTYDRASLQRGFQVYTEVCSACHAMHLLSYRNLAALGYNDGEIKAIAARVTTTDGPNDQGEMFDRPGKPSDRFHSPFPNEKASRAANNGALPKDLSLIVKAREGNEDYIYSLLTGYVTPPAGVTVNNGMYYNNAFPGHQIAMPPPLTDGRVTFAAGADGKVPPNDTASEAKDVVQFLAWAAEPKLEQRHRIGFSVMSFLIVFAGVMYASKKRIWRDEH